MYEYGHNYVTFNIPKLIDFQVGLNMNSSSLIIPSPMRLHVQGFRGGEFMI